MELAAVAAVLAFAVFVAWLADLRWHPYARCWACRGKGRNRGSTPRRYGLCGRCDGTGRRVRAGARLVRPGLKGK
jgi:DnaJ-class molecular chaperone